MVINIFNVSNENNIVEDTFITIKIDPKNTLVEMQHIMSKINQHINFLTEGSRNGGS